MAITDSRYLFAEVDRLKSQVHELRALNRVAQEERARTAELLVSFVTSTQLDAALSTKVSLGYVNAQMDVMRSEVAAQLAQKADFASLISMQNTKLDVSVFDATTWDLQKLRVAMEQDARDLYASYVAQVESQVNSKVGIEDFIRVFDPEATGPATSLETAALRISKMMDQLKLLQSYMEEDRQRQQRVEELKGNILDLKRKQTVDRNVMVQLKNATQVTKAQLHGLNEESGKVVVNLQSLAEMRKERQELTQEEKRAKKARQAQLASDVKQLQAHSENITKKLSELEKFAHSGLASDLNIKLKDNNMRLQNELTKASSTYGHHYQQISERLDKATILLLSHKERFVQLDASVRKLASLLKETQGDLNTVKGPLATLATNLHEENVAILQEIERSQNGARNLMLDYQDLLDRGKSTHMAMPLPSRPLSLSHNSVSDFTLASRKHKQHTLLATKAINRSKERDQACSPLNKVSLLGARQSAGAVRSTRSSSLPWRAQTAGSIPQAHSNVTEMLSCCEQKDSLLVKPHIDVNQEVRHAIPVVTGKCETRETKSVPSSSFRLAAGCSGEDLFHFP